VPALCFVVDDEPAVGRFIARALREVGDLNVEQFVDLPSMALAIHQRIPDIIFLDVSLGTSDAVDAIRYLSAIKYRGAVQLMSGRGAGLLDDVRLIGERHGLRMRAALTKPFRVDRIAAIAHEERLLSGGIRPEENPVDGERPPSLRVDLREALDRNWLEVWYQPKLAVRGRSLAGAEGLARVRHPDHGIVLPSAFIPQARDEDLTALAEYALHVALRDASDFAGSGRTMRLAINMPVESLMRLPVAAIVRDAHGKRNDWPGIIIEVTEDQVIRDIPAAHEIATQLRIYQIGLALDDFGSGYSSLARLKELPFAELKLDRSFVSGCSLNADNAALCRTSIELAHRFGCVAVAEGVETAGDLATIQQVGCDLAQGFLFARAMPKAALITHMVANGLSGIFSPAATAAASA
jgi:EAL domain-containing protein (putative c-di-GMP-specific phosphodiesterase class I)